MPADEQPWGDPFMGEIRMMASDRAPVGWVTCDGQALSPSNYPELFAKVGTAFGGDGTTSFQLPDLRGRAPVHVGREHPLGRAGGTEKADLGAGHLPSHGHGANATKADASHTSVEGHVPAALELTAQSAYGMVEPLNAISPDMITAAGEGAPHENMQPFVCLNFVMALAGDWPAPGPRPIPAPVESPFLGEVRLWAAAGDFVERSFLPCDGRELPIAQHTALYDVLRDRFGPARPGSFKLPLLEDRVPVHAGQGAGLTARAVGQAGGAAEVKLTEAEMPVHDHRYRIAATEAVERSPKDQALAQGVGVSVYGRGREGYPVELAEAAVLPAGSGKAHDNMQPYVAMKYHIAIQGIYPFHRAGS